MNDAAMIVAVRLDAAEFGLPIERVREVLTPPPITRVPFVPPAICGVASVRGTILPVLDLGLRLLGSEAARPGQLVVVSGAAGDGPIGLLVDAATGLVEAPPEAIQPPPAEAEATLPPGFILGVVAPEPGRLVTLLDISRVLAVGEPAEKEL
ncbi:MAG TPA: chemotaxis protein CheW [Longimicrobiaceae bacterium]|nr:chemotaxis protein CheW [Longimicrobiaceae bacterium]